MINHTSIYYSYINMHICIHLFCFFPHGFLVWKKVRYDNRQDSLQVKWVPILWQAKGVRTTTDRFRCRRCRVLKIDVEVEYSQGGTARVDDVGPFSPPTSSTRRAARVDDVGPFSLEMARVDDVGHLSPPTSSTKVPATK